MASDRPPGDVLEESWQELFGYTDLYQNQADAIRTAIETGYDNGFLLMEGPCGTGKTMAALTAAATLIRATDQYDNVVVITPVKQQLQQFVADLRTMNAEADTSLSGIALVGKADLCPYGREGVFPDGVGVYERCDDLRDNTAALVEAQGTGSGTPAPVRSASVRSLRDDTDIWWDPERASALTRAARRETTEVSSTVDGTLATADAVSPYIRQQPAAPESMVESGDTPLYCPFEADWYARNKGSPVGFTDGPNRVLTSEDLLPASIEQGICPHRVMGVLLEEADVVVGNYNHLFDARTRELTSDILDDRTFVIVDEAHRLEERVRDLLSERIGQHSLRQARGDIDRLLRYASRDSAAKDDVTARLAAYDIPLGTIERVQDFYTEVEAWLETRIESYLTAHVDDYDGTMGRSALPQREIEIPLRDPSTVETDELTAWAAEKGYGDDFCRQLGTIGAAVEEVLAEIEPDRTCVCTAVGTLLSHWWMRDDSTYFREITLEFSPKDLDNPSAPWEQVYTPALVMYNCMPAQRLQEVFDSLGGGILMSATLEPLDVLKEVVGLGRFTSTETAARDRPVVERTYELPFPEDNRASWVVDATPFTVRNRGEPDPANRNETREEYAYILRMIAESPGNVLIAMPNYREAAWAGERLLERIDKPVLVDESSSNRVTEELKREFFAGGGKVLVTSTRGTLTEGVDYKGAKLSTCAVVGIPLVNIGSPRVQAVERAYAEAFGQENSFEYALTIPAVRRARQAIGRVIRGPEETGVRIFVDTRYTADARRNSVYEYLPSNERAEFVRMKPMFLESQIDEFWG